MGEGGDIMPKSRRGLCAPGGRDSGGTRGERTVIGRGMRRDKSIRDNLSDSEAGGWEIWMSAVPGTAHGLGTQDEGYRG